MNAGLIGRWLASGGLDLPLPGSGDTAQRWLRLAELTETDVVAGRLAEAHTDAVAILAELGGPEPEPGQLWGVWAAESRDAAVSARGEGDAVTLDGTKVWCSGAGLCTHALVTARLRLRRAGTVRGRPSTSRPCDRCPAPGATRGWPNPTRAPCNSAARRPSPSARRGSTCPGPDSGTARSVSAPAGSAVRGRWRRRCTRAPPRIPSTRTRWRTSVRWTPRWPRARRC